jgi:hypothetical protein
VEGRISGGEYTPRMRGGAQKLEGASSFERVVEEVSVWTDGIGRGRERPAVSIGN